MKKSFLRYQEGVKSGRITVGTDKALRKKNASTNRILASTSAAANVGRREEVDPVVEEPVVEELDTAVKESLASTRACTAASNSSLAAGRAALTAVQALQQSISTCPASSASTVSASADVAVALKAAEEAVRAAEATSAAVQRSGRAARALASALNAFLDASADADDASAGDSSGDRACLTAGGRLAIDDDAAVGCVPSIGIAASGQHADRNTEKTDDVSDKSKSGSKRGKKNKNGKMQAEIVVSGDGSVREKENGKDTQLAQVALLPPQEVLLLSHALSELLRLFLCVSCAMHSMLYVHLCLIMHGAGVCWDACSARPCGGAGRSARRA